MKVYLGARPPFNLDTDKTQPDGVLTVIDGETGVPSVLPSLPGRKYGWGKLPMRGRLTVDIHGGNTAMAILTDFLGSVDKAQAIYMRFNGRVIQTQDGTKPLRLEGDKVAEVVAEIIENDRGMAGIRDQVNRELERPPVASDTVVNTVTGDVMAPENKG